MVTVKLHCRISGSFQMPSKVRFPLKSSREITSRYSYKLTSKIKLLEVCVRQKSRFEKFVWTGRIGDLELTFAHTCAVVTAECILLTGRALENWANHRRREGDGGIQRRSKRSIYCFVTLDIRSLIPIPYTGYIVFLRWLPPVLHFPEPLNFTKGFLAHHDGLVPVLARWCYNSFYLLNSCTPNIKFVSMATIQRPKYTLYLAFDCILHKK